MKFRYFLILVLIFSLTILSGCACEHTWTEADCLTSRTCSQCQETEGDPLGHDWNAATCQTPKTCARCGLTEGEVLAHTPGSWEETRDPITAQLTAVQHCTLCQAQTDTRSEALETLVEGGIFVFTPEEFMQRLAWIAEQNSDSLTWEFFPDGGLTASVLYRDIQYLIQFFHDNTSPMTYGEQDRATVWCVSLTVMGDSDPDLRSYFYMACDPALIYGEETTQLDLLLLAAALNASLDGSITGYEEYNQLLYESIWLSAELYGLGTDMSLVNIYASSFLD